MGGALRELVLDMNGSALRHPAPSKEQEPPGAWPRLAAVTQPALVPSGELDFPSCIARDAAIAACIPRARAHLVRGTAHLPSLERPDERAPVIRSFLVENLDRH